MASYQAVDVSSMDGVEAVPATSNRVGKAVIAALALAATGAFVATRGTGLAQSAETTDLYYSKSGTRPKLHAYVDAM